MFVPDLPAQAWTALSGAGLHVHPETVASVMRDVWRDGETELARLRTVAGIVGWRRLMTALKLRDPEKACSRVLGFGSVLTHALANGVSGETGGEQVRHLGAVANFLVSAFDRVADRTEGGLLVDYASLTRFAARPARSWADYLNPTSSAAFGQIVRHYYASLGVLSFSGTNAAATRLVHRTIVRMYRAEVASLGPCSVDNRTARRKSRLPFVVMGLPALLTIPSTSGMAGYLKWLCACGDLFGWLDDVVDLDSDVRTGRANRVIALARTLERDGDAAGERSAAHAAVEAVTSAWQTVLARTSDYNAINIIAVAAMSWCGRIPAPISQQGAAACAS